MTMHIVFSVADVEYAVPVASVLQLESYTGATLVPGAENYVAGVVTLRGRVIPVVDLRRRFGLPDSAVTIDSRIVVVSWEGRVVALRVDLAREVVKLDDTQHQPAPSVVSERSAGFIHAVHPMGNRLLLLLDLSKVLGDTQHDDTSSPQLDDKRRPALPA